MQLRGFTFSAVGQLACRAPQLFKADVDEWGSPLQYRMINRNSYKVVSLGPDKEAMTKDDVVHQVTVTRPAKSTDDANKPLTWREKRIIELHQATFRIRVIGCL